MNRSLVALASLLLVVLPSAHGQSGPLSLTANQAARAEKLILRFEEFEAFILGRPPLAEYKSGLKKLLSAVNKAAGTLPEGDVKTGLMTAAHMYESAALDWDSPKGAGPAGSQCANEKPGAYRRLCERRGSRRDLFWDKARLHVGWVKATLSRQKGGRSDLDSTALNEMEAERRNDKALAGSAVTALKRLDRDVVVHGSLGEFEEDPKLARVSFETFGHNLREVSASVTEILSWLPRNRLRVEIRNALWSYKDGGYWWGRAYQPRVVNAFNFFPAGANRLPTDTAYLATVPYTVAINWRSARAHIRRAEAMLAEVEVIGRN